MLLENTTALDLFVNTKLGSLVELDAAGDWNTSKNTGLQTNRDKMIHEQLIYESCYTMFNFGQETLFWITMS